MAKDKYKNIIKLDRSVREIPAEELREYWGHLKADSDVMRNIVLNEKDFCDCKYDRSQREFWYKTVKPTLEKLGKLSDSTEDTMTHWDKVLSRYLGELVKDDMMTYQDIRIVDRSRQYDVPAHFSFHPYSNIVVAVEKDTVYHVVNDIASLLKCSCFSCKGQAALGSIEQIVRGIAQCSREQEEPYAEVIMLILTDYDPSGYTISKSLIENMETLMKNLGLGNLRLVAKRIGLTPDQMTEDEVRHNMYTPKKKKLDEWFAETGGIFLDGQHLKKGLELDALDAEQIRRMFAEELKSYIDPDIYKEYVKGRYLENLLTNEVNKYTDQLKEKLKTQFISQVDCSDININKHILDGDNYIPFWKYCHVDGVDEAVAKVFSKLDFTA